ncbi:MAG TPA: aspartate kinase, partial [Longimicrobiales bacterium]|nr:aspartate kinase [Longimicrobiales bacterium]
MLVVQKYGGTSVGDPDRIKRVAQRVVKEKRKGNELVVVVSAMGDSTDDLVDLAARVSPNARKVHPREMDMLLTSGERITMALTAMAIRDLGVEAISLTGSQAAIITDEAHTGARIQEVRATRVREELDHDRVVIVAGFQGVSRAKEVTTLGRGGSDTTAVALAAALGAERCDIFTDVDGVYTADPRKVKSARRIELIDYQEMIELATSGAQVMHPRAVEIGARYNVPIRVLSSFRDDDDGGTLITRKERRMETLQLTGLACEGAHVQVILRGLPADMAIMTDLLSRLAEQKISVDMVTQADLPGDKRQLQLTVREDSLNEALAVCDETARAKGGQVESQPGLTRLSMVGSGMHNTPGVYAR